MKITLTLTIEEVNAVLDIIEESEKETNSLKKRMPALARELSARQEDANNVRRYLLSAVAAYRAEWLAANH